MIPITIDYPYFLENLKKEIKKLCTNYDEGVNLKVSTKCGSSFVSIQQSIYTAGKIDFQITPDDHEEGSISVEELKTLILWAIINLAGTLPSFGIDVKGLEKFENKWISITDELPIDGQEINVYAIGKDLIPIETDYIYSKYIGFAPNITHWKHKQ